ncbi:exodeoxyribonuclease VII small subunit [Bombilactobacillus bombi]|uniref:exodeoxyribonuclease VII small subunit n=1 Tax=Bombilactobacillus bombi TaxID=1303590 RepID=UPI0015E5BF11|nr:exodeoxyribonuclease VII small subunit [Bombilactobacillus bombi]MBA1435140.1 exodeoxyribonuclease VII small subunit [Bombilactobacillus bombi]
MTNKKTFEENLTELQQIVDELQQGDVPLEKAMTQFQKGVQLSQTLEKTLSEAEKKLTQVMTADGQESDFQLNNQESSDQK